MKLRAFALLGLVLAVTTSPVIAQSPSPAPSTGVGGGESNAACTDALDQLAAGLQADTDEAIAGLADLKDFKRWEQAKEPYYVLYRPRPFVRSFPASVERLGLPADVAAEISDLTEAMEEEYDRTRAELDAGVVEAKDVDYSRYVNTQAAIETLREALIAYGPCTVSVASAADTTTRSPDSETRDLSTMLDKPHPKEDRQQVLDDLVAYFQSSPELMATWEAETPEWYRFEAIAAGCDGTRFGVAACTSTFAFTLAMYAETRDPALFDHADRLADALLNWRRYRRADGRDVLQQYVAQTAEAMAAGAS